jgi:general secretion pathway protein G
MKNSEAKRVKAFTLIEILVALTIIGVLLTFVAPMVLNRPDQARNLKLKNDYSAIETALNLYRLDNGRFPNKNEGLAILINSENNSLGYLVGQPKDPWGQPYEFDFKPSGGLQVKSAGPDGVFDPAGKGDDNFSKIFK